MTDAAPLLRFLSTCEETVAGHEQLLGVLERERRLVVEGQIDALITCLSEKEGALAALAALETRRRAELGVLSAGVGCTVAVGRIAPLIPLVPDRYRNRLESCQAQLDALTARAARLNRINGRLIDRVRAHTESLVGLLRRLACPPTAYAPSGRFCEVRVSGRTLGEG
jgi:flagellar biosynthesis/type III secretory pathway chaperone